MLLHTVRRDTQSRGLGPVCLVSDWVLPESPAGHAGQELRFLRVQQKSLGGW